jgi:peptidoglycan/LPS O-acetylase OafA/YrhL
MGHTVLYATMMWGFMLGFTGLFVRFAAHPSPRWRYVADSSYWVYLLHLPVVVALQVWLARVPLHWSLKLPLILLLATPVLFFSYDRLVRPTWVGRWLNGRRHPRGWPPARIRQA